jgi:mono/diheme cytochrome c family protein
MATQDNKSDSKLTADSREESQDGVNSGGVVAFVISMVVTFACFIYVTFMSGGVDLKEVKATDESGAVQTIAAAPEKVDVSDITEPWVPNEKMVAHGASVYKTNCAMCHGEKGAGDGIAGGSLNPKPRNLIEGKWKQGGTSLALFATLQNGIPGGSMQGYKDALPAKDRWALVQFTRSITGANWPDDEAELKAKAPGLK